MIDERYLYEIHPHKPIKNLIPGRAIVKPCSMKLTKSEVKTCMSGGPVFRLFPGKKGIRVVGSNLDQLHVSKYEEYEKLTKASNQTINDENYTRVTEGVTEEPKTEAPTKVVPEEITPVAKTEEIPEEINHFVNLDTDMYESNGEIVESYVTGKKAFVSIETRFPAGSSVEDVKRIKEDAEKELKEKVEEKRKELDIPDPEPIQVPVESDSDINKEEFKEEVVEETTESPDNTLEDSEIEEVVGVGDIQQTNPISVNVNYNKKHKKNRY